MEVKRGEIYMVDFGTATGNVQRGVRPAVIVSNDVCNRYSPTVTVIPLTSRQKKPLPTHFIVTPGERSGLQAVSTALCEQVQTIGKSQLIRLMGSVDKSLLRDLNLSISVQLGLVPAEFMACVA